MRLAFTAIMFLSAAFTLSRAYKSYMQAKNIDFFVRVKLLDFWV